MQRSPARMRVEQETTRHGNAGVVISTVLSLVVVAAAVGVVAWLVLRTPSPAVDSAERLDPVGTALPAPTEQPALPTLVPTTEPETDNEAEPEPTALGFTGDAQVAELPAAPTEAPAPVEDAGPTPTPRVIAQPTAPPAAPTPQPTLPPAPTLPPSVPVTQVPVVALDPVEAAPPPTAAPAPTQEASAPTPVPDENDDPFNIFDDDPRDRAEGIENEALERVRQMQEERREGRSIVVPTFAPGDERRRDDASDEESIDFPDSDADADNEPAIVASRDEPRGNAMPDVDAMIDEITARATNRDRDDNDRDRDGGRRITGRDDDDDDDDEDKEDEDTDRRRRHRSAREIIEDRLGRDSDSRVIFPRGGDNQPCTDPTAEGFPFNC